MTTMKAIQIHEHDTVGVALTTLRAGEAVQIGSHIVLIQEEILAGHKFALRPIALGEAVMKYGHQIGRATSEIPVGTWVHGHNLKTNLSGEESYTFHQSLSPKPAFAEKFSGRTFLGYRRKNGRVGTRNEIWIINTVGCVNGLAEQIAKRAHARYEGIIDGVFSFSHPYGCSQLGDDLENTQKVLAGLMRNPNAGGVLVIGLGCENNQLKSLLKLANGIDESRLKFFNSQDVADEIDAGLALVAELVEVIQPDRRTPCPISDLVIGMKCGGSDGFSGITANPLVGRISDILSVHGGTAILTEVPEMFGAERLLMNRCDSQETFATLVDMINHFKRYFISHHQPVYENPSPGNKGGGITTLEEKSLGAIQKGGSATVTQILNYGEPVSKSGLALLNAPGNDAISSTAEAASGATMILFTTGRGTPLGFPVPTIKVSSNSEIAKKKPNWIDFNAGALLEGTSMTSLTDDFFEFILNVASGNTKTNNEKNGYREIAIWKDGVTL
jgi:altronate hydrolase